MVGFQFPCPKTGPTACSQRNNVQLRDRAFHQVKSILCTQELKILKGQLLENLIPEKMF